MDGIHKMDCINFVVLRGNRLYSDFLPNGHLNRCDLLESHHAVIIGANTLQHLRLRRRSAATVGRDA